MMSSATNRTTTRRTVLMCAGLAGAGGAAVLLTACSTSAVPYDANAAGQAPGPNLAATPAPSDTLAPATASPPTSNATAPNSTAASPAGTGPAGTSPAGTGPAGGGASGTLLGQTSDIPAGGGLIFTDARVVVTQPTNGVFKAFSAVCTHMGCLCNQVAGGTIDCPCHGSKFTIADGAVVAGPAPAPLAPVSITVTDGSILVQ
jgi:Rieske Fe-S protein